MFKDNVTFADIANAPAENIIGGASSSIVGMPASSMVALYPNSAMVACTNPMFATKEDLIAFLKANNVAVGDDDAGLFGFGKYFDYALFAVAGGLLTYFLLK